MANPYWVSVTLFQLPATTGPVVQDTFNPKICITYQEAASSILKNLITFSTSSHEPRILDILSVLDHLKFESNDKNLIKFKLIVFILMIQYLKFMLIVMQIKQ